MNPILEVLLYAGLAWALFYLLWRILEQKYAEAFANLQDRWQLSVSLFHIRWTTERLNPIFALLGRNFGTFWDVWFGLGVAFGLCACFGSVALLVYNLVHMATKKPAEQMLLTPVIPGVNVPTHQLFSYFVALLISGVFHEVGHAIAAVRDRKTVSRFGIFLLGIYPGAFVDIREDFLTSGTPAYKQLKIVCAGVWHNFTLALLALALVSVVPFMVLPFYGHANGVIISAIPEGSAFAGNVHIGATIVGLNSHAIHSSAGWEAAFLALHEQKTPTGWCTPLDMQTEGNARSIDCCKEPTKLQCFVFSHSDAPRNVCLSARALVMQQTAPCSTQLPCSVLGHTCALPVLEQGEHIIKLELSNGSFLLFMGPLAELWHSLTVTDLQPRLWIFPVSLPRHLETSLRYLFTMSLAMSILNLTPVYHLDGEWSTRAFIALLLPWVSEARRQNILTWIFRSVTALFVVNIVLSMISL